MAQDPAKPRSDGKVKMPAVDNAMNKIAPAFKRTDDKGDKGALGAPKGERARHEKILARAMKRLEKAIAAESKNRKNALDDRKFKVGDQWPSAIVAQRNLDDRPCHTINKLPVFIRQITNDQRQNRPSINISPVGDRGDADVAKMYRGLIRFIERDCAADIAYDTAFEDAVTMGWGYWRILIEWEAPGSFNQTLAIRQIRNPFTVYLDPAHQDPTGADAQWGFVTEMMPRDEFEDKHPDLDQMAFSAAGIGEPMKNWISADEIRIAEYFEVKYETRTLVQLDNGHEGWEDELDDITLANIKRGKVNITDERESRVPNVMWYKLTAKDVIKEEEWVGTTIPIVKVLGRATDIEGKLEMSGIVRDAKDPQRAFNYWRTAQTELIALAPKAPWVVEEGQIEGHEDEWRTANIRSTPYLSYKGTSIAGHPAPPPQRQQFAGVPAGVVQATEGAAQDIMATTGIRFDSTMNERMIDESGKAIRELRRQGDIGAFDFIDNLARSLRRTGEILVEAIPKLFVSAQVVTILREGDKEEQVKIDPSLPKASGEMRKPDGKMIKLFNPKFGKYGVTVTIGPSYATQRIEASENMIAFAKALPQTGALIADLIAKSQDWPEAEVIAARLAKTLPPGLLAPDMKDVPPQVQAILQQQDAKVKELGQQLQQAMMALQDKSADRAVDVSKINHDFEAKLLKIVADTETRMAATEEKSTANFNAHIGAQIKELGGNVASLIHAMEQKQPGDGPGAGDPAASLQQPQAATPPDDDQLPPEAAQHLAEGRVTTFGNGHRYTMKNGKPAKVEDDE